MKLDLSSREDIHLLVTEFYNQAKGNDEIGYFFNKSITNWDEHINKITDFWESNLFFKSVYHGNPKKAHIDLDTTHNYSIENKHFGIWLMLWFQTIDKLFEGDLAERAKHNARKMSTHFYMGIFKNRVSNS